MIRVAIMMTVMRDEHPADTVATSVVLDEPLPAVVVRDQVERTVLDALGELMDRGGL